MELKDMTVEQLEERKAQIVTELDAPEADLDALESEARSIKEELEARKEAEAQKAEIRAAVANGAGEVIKTFEEKVEEPKMFGIETKEYRDAFMANLVGQATPEQRAILADNSAYGDGLSLPTGLDKEIWDQVTTAHPILADVDILRSGIAIKVTKMTPAAISKKMDSAASAEQTFTGVDVTLVGADYHTYVTLSYAEAKMSQGAMERFLVKEVADAIGEALAKDVFARILSDAGAGQKVTPAQGSTMFENIKAAMALAIQARRPVIYAPATAYYEIVGAIAQGSPFNIGNTLGCEVKLDSAATKVTIVDPSMFVLNVIQDTIIESERDAKNAQFVIGGYMRAEGCLRKTTAAAYIN
jgi:HK97 family phage major capsid protein